MALDVSSYLREYAAPCIFSIGASYIIMPQNQMNIGALGCSVVVIGREWAKKTRTEDIHNNQVAIEALNEQLNLEVSSLKKALSEESDRLKAIINSSRDDTKKDALEVVKKENDELRTDFSREIEVSRKEAITQKQVKDISREVLEREVGLSVDKIASSKIDKKLNDSKIYEQFKEEIRYAVLADLNSKNESDIVLEFKKQGPELIQSIADEVYKKIKREAR